MSLLHDIQAALLDEEAKLGPILLKLRFLAARLGSDFLEDWVRYELEGYPQDMLVPDYRVTSVAYTGTFTNGYQNLNDVSIPSHSVAKYAGEDWVKYGIREPLSVVDDIIEHHKRKDNTSHFSLNTGDLKISLQGKIYEDFAIIDIMGIFGTGAFITIQNAVRAKILDLTLSLEKSVPGAVDIAVGQTGDATTIDSDSVSDVAHQIINYGTVTTIHSSGDQATVNVQVAQGNKDELVAALSKNGVPKDQAEEFADIVSSEEPDHKTKALGPRARGWLGEKITSGATDLWKAGTAVGTRVLTEAALKYYNLK